MERAENLKDYARSLLEDEKDTARGSLELIDTFQQLGLSHHFVDDINRVIEEVSVHQNKEDDLLYTALKFRILRQNGRMIPEGNQIPIICNYTSSAACALFHEYKENRNYLDSWEKKN